MMFLSKIRGPIVRIGTRNLHKTALTQSGHEEWDEKKFLMETKPWEDFSPRIGYGVKPNPVPILDEMYDEPHGEKLIPYFWAMVLLGIIPLSIYGWYDEYQHRIAHPKRIRHPKQDFLYGEPKGRTTFPFGDGKHSPMFHPYWNFVKEGYETDKDGNPLPPGVYADE